MSVIPHDMHKAIEARVEPSFAVPGVERKAHQRIALASRDKVEKELVGSPDR